MYLQDNYDRWKQHEAEKEEQLKKLPQCSECHEHIQDDFAYYINGEWICENCMDSYKREVQPEW